MNCALVQRHIGALVDGELDPATLVEFDRHIAGCADCQELLAFDRMVRGELQRASLEQNLAPAHLSERIRISLADAEAAKGTREPLVRVVPVPLHQMIPMAAAAAVVLVFFGSAAGFGGDDEINAAGMPIFRDIVQLHSHQLPPDVRVEDEPPPAPLLNATNTTWGHRAGRVDLQSYFQGRVEFPVRPARFERGDVQLVGARVSHVRERRAAALYYTVNGRRVTVVMFRSPPALGATPRVRVGNAEVGYGSADGYAVPVVQHDGISYAFTGDLTRDELMQLAASARVSY